MSTAQSLIKVPERTRKKVRYAASMSGLKQSELVERAVDEYVENHREQFTERVKEASTALLGNSTEIVAYALAVSVDDVKRIGG